MDGISKETFERMDDASRQNVLFDYAVETNKMLQALSEKVENLDKKAIRWGAIGGVLSAAGAYLAALFVGHVSK